ncbi:hypothetical protein ACSBR1_026965 [Camellia fascicularis]
MLVMSCVTTVQSAILWNGEVLEDFALGKGLRQGDPLSPYLFVLCMERLSNMICHKAAFKTWNGISLSRGGLCITHLFFADDLLLFASENPTSYETIMETLNEFSDISGLQINTHKFKMFVSPNVNCSYARTLSSLCGIPLTRDLGKYLGVPLLHGRISRSHFNSILEKMQKRLAGWKINTLSLAGRATLIQSVTSAIPACTMQTMKVPIRVCDDIDRLNRNFLWGDTLEHRKIHLIKWDQVCKKKEDGGLGIRRARDNNLALLTKLSWKILCDEGGLWIDVLKAKYLKHNTIHNWPTKRKASHFWRGLLITRNVLSKGVKWTIGDGTKVRIWKDWWCGDTTLDEAIPNHESSNSATISTILNEEKEWDMDLISNQIPEEAIPDILRIHPPQFLNLIDKPCWKGSHNGGFTSAAAYDIIVGKDQHVGDWKWLWKLRIPQKLKGFLWVVLNGRLFTNDMRMRRGLTNDSNCISCNNMEDLNHVLRTCPQAGELWASVFNTQWYLRMLNTPLLDWIIVNAKNKTPYSNYISFGTIFIVALWRVWTNRNKKIFENKNFNSFESVKFIFEFSLEIHMAFSRSIVTPKKSSVLIRWIPPFASLIKLNSDGCLRESLGIGGFGGLFRDEQGAWISGYYDRIESRSSLEAELWAVYKGLIILLQRGLTKVVIETDAEQVVQLLKEGPGDNFSFRGLVEDARIILRGCKCEVIHVMREGNTCADALAKLGVEQPEDLLVVNEPPAEIRSLLVADMLGFGRVRD